MSAVSPPDGIDALAAAIDAHGASIDRAARRQRARLAGALVEYATEHGEQGLRRLGGQRRAEGVLAEQAPGLDVAGLVALLEARAGLATDGPSPGPGRRPRAHL